VTAQQPAGAVISGCKRHPRGEYSIARQGPPLDAPRKKIHPPDLRSLR